MFLESFTPPMCSSSLIVESWADNTLIAVGMPRRPMDASPHGGRLVEDNIQFDVVFDTDTPRAHSQQGPRLPSDIFANPVAGMNTVVQPAAVVLLLAP